MYREIQFSMETKDQNESMKAIESLPEINPQQFAREFLQSKQPALFLDYDGTLTPIVENPDDALLAQKTKNVLSSLAQTWPVTIISGRDRHKVKQLIGIEAIYYAGSHGFDISGPDHFSMEHPEGQKLLPVLNEAEAQMREALKHIPGLVIERKKYAIALHYRRVQKQYIPEIKEKAEAYLKSEKRLKSGGGKMILELKPNIDWNKGKAMQWLINALNLKLHPVYIGDDLTDEDAFKALQDAGTGILVGDHEEKTYAQYHLPDHEEVYKFLYCLDQAGKNKF